MNKLNAKELHEDRLNRVNGGGDIVVRENGIILSDDDAQLVLEYGSEKRPVKTTVFYEPDDLRLVVLD